MTVVVSRVLKPLVEKLASSAFEECQLGCGVKDDREKIKNTLETIQRVLADAEQRQTKDEAVRIWLSKLKDFCYDAEDVLNEFQARGRQARSTKHLTLKRKVCYLSSWISNFFFQFKMAHNMKELRKRLDGINGEKTQFNLSSDVYDKTTVTRRETHSFVSPSNVIGRNEEKEMIIELLERSDDGRAGMIEVIPILGIGGIGKTTLAQLVYNDDWVNKHFDLKVWLYMPVEFKVENIIRGIIKSLGHTENYDSLEMLQNCLRSIVEAKRCLFVMDDVWKVRREDWVGLRDLLGGISEGSKVILTSRNISVASIMGTVPPLNLANLSRKDSLTLFIKCAFDQGQEKNHPDLMVIGEEIVSKCWGNPQAVKALGSMLYSKNNQRYDERPYRVVNSMTGKEVILNPKEFREWPVEHLQPNYMYPYRTYNDTLIDRSARDPAANASSRKSSTSKQGSTSSWGNPQAVKALGSMLYSKNNQRYDERPYRYVNSMTGKEVILNPKEFREWPVEHLQPNYMYPYRTYNDTLIDRSARDPAANASSRKSSTSKQGSTSKGKSQDKGKSVAK